MIAFIRWAALLAIGLTALPGLARTPDDIAGRVVGEVDGRLVELPLLKADYDVSIAGDVATVVLKQRFANPSGAPMTAEYLFPLNQRAAVYAMEMRVGDEVVRARIQETAKAVQTFETARREGKAASLLIQHRPNMFTQKIANLMPGLPVEVTLRYVQAVPQIDGRHELVVPLIVGPRYEGADPGDRVVRLDGDDRAPADDAGPGEDGVWTIEPVPDYPPTAGVNLPPDVIDPDRVSLSVRIAGGGVPVADVASATHALAVQDGEEATLATLAEGRTIGNRDFVLRYALGGEAIAAGALTHLDERGGTFSLLLAPPETVAEVMAMPRELVFVLDTSGSMSGQPIAASQRFMHAALSALRLDDHFRIISFSNTAQQFSEHALRATPRNLRLGRRHVDGLRASGGTEIDRAIRTAFDTRQPDGTLRIVVFLSDGYIGGEAQVLKTIRDRIGDARIYAFGIGSSVNRYLLDAMAEEGRGYARYVDPTETASEAAEKLARDLRTPVLTDIAIDWGDLAVSEVRPARLPDLFEGNTIRVLGRYEGGGKHRIRITGQTAGGRASMPLTIDLPTEPGTAEGTEALPLMWARETIRDLERDYATQTGNPRGIEARITALGLEYALQTRYTSFVATSEQVVNDTGQVAPVQSVPQPMVAGVETPAYGNTADFNLAPHQGTRRAIDGTQIRVRKSAQLAQPDTPELRAKKEELRRQYQAELAELAQSAQSDGGTPPRNAFAPVAQPLLADGPAPQVVAPAERVAPQGGFAGASTPEPRVLTGLAVLAFLAGLTALLVGRRRSA